MHHSKLAGGMILALLKAHLDVGCRRNLAM